MVVTETFSDLTIDIFIIVSVTTGGAPNRVGKNVRSIRKCCVRNLDFRI